MKSVSVSDAVAVALNASGKSADDLLRAVLHVKPEGLVTPEGVVFPEGTRFLAWYGDRPYWARVVDGAIELYGERFTSVSAAAKRVTGRSTNGWLFWQARLPGSADFVDIDSLRQASRG